MGRMGIGSRVGVGATGGGVSSTPPLAPDAGSGGEGALSVGPLNFGPAAGEIGDVTTGRITLAMLNTVVLGMLAFYVWTRSAQGS